MIDNITAPTSTPRGFKNYFIYFLIGLIAFPISAFFLSAGILQVYYQLGMRGWPDPFILAAALAFFGWALIIYVYGHLRKSPSLFKNIASYVLGAIGGVGGALGILIYLTSKIHF